jgi:transcriptional regulator GlxA family with amidase domain
MIDIGILIFDDVEELDFVGPWEVWNMVNTVLRTRNENAAVRVRLISENEDQIRAVKGMRVLADTAISDVKSLDVVCIPGGQGVRPLIQKPQTITWVKDIAPTCKWVTSVCTGAFVLSKSGLTKDKRLATHWAAFDEFRNLGLDGILVPHIRYVRDGNILTSAGVSAGIDMALWLVGELFSPQFARDVQRAMQYDPSPPYAGDV